MKLSVDRALRQAATLAGKGDKAQAAAIYRDVLLRFPANRRARVGLAALEAAPADANALFEEANALWRAGRLEEAIRRYDATLRIRPDLAAAHNNRGNALKQLRRLDDALTSFDLAVRCDPAFAGGHYNRGNVLKELNRYEEALAAFDAALRLRPDFADAQVNRGNVLQVLRRHEDALASYDAALRLGGDVADAHNNRGNALRELGRLEEALQCFDRAIALQPAFANAHNGRGHTLKAMRRLDEALASHRTALRLRPGFTSALGEVLSQRAHICEWRALPGDCDVSSVGADGDALPPFALLAFDDDPQQQQHRAMAWARAVCPVTRPPLPRPPQRPAKLRIGYFSGDFHDHATMWLMARLFELHDRERFEIHAFSFGPDRKDAMRTRLLAAVDAFHDVRASGDREIAELARSLAIDVAVDLKGYTRDSRPNIFAHRAAPVQMNYLGFPGTMGADFIDYVIADEVVLPEPVWPFYSEKVITLPGSYQVNDDRRVIADRPGDRADFGLPENGFVFCCFNNNYKITPAEFDVWMRLLGEVGGSVLWLLDDNRWAKANLMEEAAARGINPARLVFAARIPLADHLARQRCADLFLDTFNYNAHTTASDALWAGLPVVTKAGRTFPARVAASLLAAIGLPELITDTIEDYQELARALATEPGRLSAIKSKLAANRLTTPLFDSKQFARHIEGAYELAIERLLAGLPPAPIRVG